MKLRQERQIVMNSICPPLPTQLPRLSKAGLARTQAGVFCGMHGRPGRRAGGVTR